MGALPPLLKADVKVTVAPEQIDISLAAIVTNGVTLSVTVIVMLLLVAVLEVSHVLLEVITTLTTSLLDKVVLVNVALLVPTLVLFTFH